MKRINFAVMLFALTILSISVAVAEDDCSCDNTVGCFDINDNPYCVPSDTTCEYKMYDWDMGLDKCAQTDYVDADTDGDGWTDGCDAFPADSEEWMDIDGDGCGYNSDINDFDPAVCKESGEDCLENADCEAGMICDAGKCVVDNGEDGTCEIDADCGADKICADGECVIDTYPVCSEDVDCASDELCIEGECVIDTYPTCSNDSDCASDEGCNEGVCEEKTEEGTGSITTSVGSSAGGITYCTLSWECADWSECEDGKMTRSCVKDDKPDWCDRAGTSTKPDMVKTCEVEPVTEENDDKGKENLEITPSDVLGDGNSTHTVEVELPPMGGKDDGKGLEGVTGRVIDFSGVRGSGLAVLLVLGGLLLLFLIAKKKKKDTDA